MKFREIASEENLTEGLDKKKAVKVAKEFLAAAKALNDLDDEIVKLSDHNFGLIPDDIGDIEQIMEIANYVLEVVNDDDLYTELDS